MEIRYEAVARVMKETGLGYPSALALIESRRSGAAGARELLKKDGYWQQAAGTKRKAKVAAKAGTPLEPRRKKTRKTGSLTHGTNPAKKGKRGQSRKVTPIEGGK